MIHIACCFDKNFEVPFAALVSSIERHSASDVAIHAFHEGPVERVKSTLKSSARLRIEFRDITGTTSRYSGAGQGSAIAFARLRLPEFLAGIPRVIYLDADMIVLRDLASLATTDLRGHPVGAVIDYPLVLAAERGGTIAASGVVWRVDQYFSSYLGLSDSSRYFNSGLLVIDLDRLAASGALEAVERLLAERRQRYIFNDQDALNLALAGNVELLDPRWNCQHGLLRHRKGGPIPAAIKSILELYDEPWIIHFSGRKPWISIRHRGPWDSLFWENYFRSGFTQREAEAATRSEVSLDPP
jgi:lipopolysaccharide biosynthesis glycosyltransferase